MSLAPATSPNIHSAEVKLALRMDGRCLPLGQIAPDYIILDPPAALPPGLAEVILTIDGRERTWSVELPEGSSSTLTRTPIRRV